MFLASQLIYFQKRKVCSAPVYAISASLYMILIHNLFVATNCVCELNSCIHMCCSDLQFKGFWLEVPNKLPTIQMPSVWQQSGCRFTFGAVLLRLHGLCEQKFGVNLSCFC